MNWCSSVSNPVFCTADCSSGTGAPRSLPSSAQRTQDQQGPRAVSYDSPMGNDETQGNALRRPLQRFNVVLGQCVPQPAQHVCRRPVFLLAGLLQRQKSTGKLLQDAPEVSHLEK